ncbi:MAG: TonB-dependent receptor [Acidobacteriota bacterium]
MNNPDIQPKSYLSTKLGGIPKRPGASSGHRSFRVTVLLGSLMLLAEISFAGAKELMDFSLEDLMSIEVTSASRKEQKLSEAAAAVYVISQEDIRHSGLSSIPELLRLVPGLQVARIDSNKWAISSRGFNSRFANKLLVLIDGRSVYTPLFSGVYWDVQDLLLEDVERIEVIRGPGATLWGANAVNGVINIITKRAELTQGGVVSTTVGNEQQAVGSVRYGGQISPRAHYRVYSKHSTLSSLTGTLGDPANDRWNTTRGGARLDWGFSAQDNFSLQGDVYRNRFHETRNISMVTPPYRLSQNHISSAEGGNILGRWTRTSSPRSSFALQFYYDRTHRDDALITETRDTFDLDFQHRTDLTSRHEIVWGTGLRFTRDHLVNNPVNAVIPSKRGDGLWSLFLQDEIRVIPNRLHVIAGSKFERNNYTGFEMQPNFRFIWTPHRKHTVWGAASRAVRVPSRASDDIQSIVEVRPINGLPGVITAYGNRDSLSEVLHAYELGYRLELQKRWSFDVSAFYNDYDRVVSFAYEFPHLEFNQGFPFLRIPVRFGNGFQGQTHGLEALVNYTVTDRWKISGGYSWLGMVLMSGSNQSITALEKAQDNPGHQFQIRSSYRLPSNLEIDGSFFRMNSLPEAPPNSFSLGNTASAIGSSPARLVPAYNRLDLRLGWRLRENFELSVGGQNLLDPHHREFRSIFGEEITEVKRSAYAKLVWRF